MISIMSCTIITKLLLNRARQRLKIIVATQNLSKRDRFERSLQNNSSFQSDVSIVLLFASYHDFSEVVRRLIFPDPSLPLSFR